MNDKCRFFRWDDGADPKQAVNGSPSATAPANTTNTFRGNGQSLSSPANWNQPQASGSSSTQRSTPAPPSSPGKRRRIDEDDEATQHSEIQDDDDIYSSHPLRQSRPGARASSKPMSQPTAIMSQQSQTVEEAMEENWDEDIEDFEDFEAGGSGKKPKVGEPATPGRRFTSFAGPPTFPLSKHAANIRTPSTPPRQLAPGLPVTPDTASTSRNRSVTSHGISKWQQIRDDPSSPFHARANALLKIEADGDVSPKSASTASLLARDTSDPAIVPDQAGSSSYETPSKTLLPTDSNTTPSKSARQASEHVTRFSNMLLTDLETLAKQSESAERQLKAMKQKATYHEKREKDAQAELSQIKEKLKLVMAENEQLRMMQT